MVCYSPKELEESVRRMYRRHIKGADEADTGDASKTTTGATGGGVKVSSLTSKLINNEDVSDDDSVGGGGMNRTGKSGSAPSTSGGGEKKKRQKDVVKEIDQELLESAQEANRQRAFINRAATDLKHRLDLAQTEAMRLSQRRLHENSRLVYECNELRLELKEQTRKYRLAIEERDRLAVALANVMPGNLIASVASNGGINRGNEEDSLKMRNIDIAAYDNVSMQSSVNSLDPRKRGAPSDSSLAEKISDDPAWLGNKQKVTKVPGVFKETSKVLYQMPSTGSVPIMPMSQSASALPDQLQQQASSNGNNKSHTSHISYSLSQPNLHLQSDARAVSPVLTKLPNVHGKAAIYGTNTTNPLEINASAQQMNSNAATLRARLNAVGKGTNNKHVEIKAKRAIGEAESLAERLDASEIEKQRLQAEITRLRFQMSKAGLTPLTNATSTNIKRSGSSPNGAMLPGTIPFTDMMMDPEGALTHADRTGSPSNMDLRRMNVSSAKGNARHMQVHLHSNAGSVASRTTAGGKTTGSGADQHSTGHASRARIVIESAGVDEADDFDSVRSGGNNSKNSGGNSSGRRGNNTTTTNGGGEGAYLDDEVISRPSTSDVQRRGTHASNIQQQEEDDGNDGAANTNTYNDDEDGVLEGDNNNDGMDNDNLDGVSQMSSLGH